MYLKNLLPHQLHDAVQRGDPLLVPAGCIETHGPHMVIGHDTIIVEEVCARIGEKTSIVIAPPFDFGPTGYALGGPADGTMDPDYESFGRYVKSIVKNFIEMGFRTTYVNIMHQGMDAPLALSFRKAAAELSFEMVLEKGQPRGWWADRERMEQERAFGSRVAVLPMVLPASSPPAGGDHAGYNETSFLLAARPELVDQSRLDDDAPWYCQEDRQNNSWTANAEHGHVMMEAVVKAWVDLIDGER